jgi:hypothetical protein
MRTSVYRKLRRSLAARGWAGTVSHAVRVALRLASPATRRAEAQRRARDDAFDRQYGVDTGDAVGVRLPELTGDSQMFAVAYEPVSSGVDFAELLREFSIPYESSVFIDLGSGKGRAVLLASLVPFKKVIGVELFEELHQTANANVRRWPADRRRCGSIELVCMDAATYALPDEPFVLYMYHPFERPVMVRVVENVMAAFRRAPRRVVVVYFSPEHGRLWERVPFLTRVLDRPGYHVYDTTPAALAGTV